MTKIPSSPSPFADRGPNDIIILDGGMGTTLEDNGADLAHPLWSAHMLRQDAQLVRDVHDAFLGAGADVISTCTYQASFEGFARNGITPDAGADLMRTAVTIARASADAAQLDGRQRWVAGSCGPYGAMLNDGSEFTGAYSVPHDELVEFHLRRARILVDAGVDFLAFETVPQLAEIRAIHDALDQLDAWAWISVQAQNENQMASGTSVVAALVAAGAHERVFAVGCNCTHPMYVNNILNAARHVVDKPFVVYPNFGRTWDSASMSWLGTGVHFDHAQAATWIELGARFIGGCCGVGPALINELAKQLRQP